MSIYILEILVTLKLLKRITYTILFYSRIRTIPGICRYQITSPDKSTFLIFRLNELRLSAVLRFLGSLDQMRGVRAHFGQSIFSFLQQKRQKDILLILIIFPYFKVQKKREKKKMVSKIDHFFIFLIWKLNLKIQKYC